MRHLLCGGTKAISHLDEKRKRFSGSLPFRRKQKQQNQSVLIVAPAAPKSPVPQVHLVVPEPVVPAPPHNIPVDEPNHIPEEVPVEPAPAPAPNPDPNPDPAPAMHAQPEEQPAGAQPEVPGAEVIVIPDDDPAPIEAPEDDGAQLAAEIAQALAEQEVRSACTAAVVTLFPDICPTYLEETCESLAYDHESVISHILDKIEDGTSYPRRAGLKRKRQASGSAGSDDEVNDAAGKSIAEIVDDGSLTAKDREDRAMRFFNSEERRQKAKSRVQTEKARTLMQQAFPYVPSTHIVKLLKEHNYCLLPSMLDLDNHISEKGQNPVELAFDLKKTKTKVLPENSIESLPETIQKEVVVEKKEILEEFYIASKLKRLRKAKRDEEKLRELEEADNVRRAQRDGSMKDCECCYVEFPENRMVHCSLDMHWFCTGCARLMAESQVGYSKYELSCMSTDGCKGGFSLDQRKIFLDAKMTLALERIEQEFVLRAAGIENLESCPFCSYSAEYPPVDINKEFVCQMEDCQAVTCRLCRKESHIPKTCAEVERESGAAVRLTIEEAMSEAMIRKCNKCSTPFIKDHGCNKMTCSRAGCYNVQCYVCHQSCDYTHFDDASRGGKKGNCPLFESAESRHEEEVQTAEENARQKIVQKNPDVNVDFLKFNMSQKVIDDENRRKNAAAAQQPAAAGR